MARTAAATGSWQIEIVKRSDLHRFVVLHCKADECGDGCRVAFEVACKTMIAADPGRLMLKRLTKPSRCS